MKQHHYYISLKNMFNSDCAIYYGTNLPKMAKAFSILQGKIGNIFQFKLDIDENYDPDCGAFRSISSALPEQEAEKWGKKALDKCDKIMADIRKEFGDEAN